MSNDKAWNDETVQHLLEGLDNEEACPSLWLVHPRPVRVDLMIDRLVDLQVDRADAFKMIEAHAARLAFEQLFRSTSFRHDGSSPYVGTMYGDKIRLTTWRGRNVNRKSPFDENGKYVAATMFKGVTVYRNGELVLTVPAVTSAGRYNRRETRILAVKSVIQRKWSFSFAV